MPVGLEVRNDDGVYVIDDRSRNFHLIGRAPFERPIPQWPAAWGIRFNGDYLTAVDSENMFVFRDAANITLPDHGAGIEVFDAVGNRRFTSALPPLRILDYFTCDVTNAPYTKTYSGVSKIAAAIINAAANTFWTPAGSHSWNVNEICVASEIVSNTTVRIDKFSFPIGEGIITDNPPGSTNYPYKAQVLIVDVSNYENMPITSVPT